MDSRVSLPRRAWRSTMRAERRMMDVLPVGLASRLNIPGRRYPAMNGQRMRREIVADIARKFPAQRVIETGTWRGSTAAFLADTFSTPVATVEADARFHAFSQRRLADRPNVRVEHGDSRDFLRALAADPEWGGRPSFVYLDAHWEKDLPLAEELRIVAGAWPEAVVMIDDFQVPDDPGYGFDDYGPDVGALTPAILPPEVDEWRVMHPAALSHAETGRRRGCCVLVAPTLFDREFVSLREVPDRVT